MASWWRELVERILPWYSPRVERMRNARTDAIARRSEESRQRAERVITEYRAATKSANQASERVVDELRRGHDERQ